MTHDHLSDEQLSAHLDGEPIDQPSASTPDADGVASCARCRQRLAAMEEARALVRRPVTPVSASVKAAAVAAALAEAGSDGAEDPTTNPTTNGSAGTAPAVTSLRRSPRWSPTGAVAAALIGLALVAGIPYALSHSGSRPTASAAHAAAQSAPTTERPSAASSATRAGITPGVADIGAVGSAQALRSRLGPALASGGDKSTFNGLGLASQPPQSDSATQSSGLPQATGKQSASSALASCVAGARQQAGAGEAVQLVVTVTYQHIAAVVVVVQQAPHPPGTTASHLAIVVARSNCRTLLRTTF